MLANPYHRLLLYTEIGQWDGSQTDKVATYRATTWPPETVGVIAFLLGRGTVWPQFELHDPHALALLP